MRALGCVWVLAGVVLAARRELVARWALSAVSGAPTGRATIVILGMAAVLILGGVVMATGTPVAP